MLSWLVGAHRRPLSPAGDNSLLSFQWFTVIRLRFYLFIPTCNALLCLGRPNSRFNYQNTRKSSCVSITQICISTNQIRFAQFQRSSKFFTRACTNLSVNVTLIERFVVISANIINAIRAKLQLTGAVARSRRRRKFSRASTPLLAT